MIDDIEDMLDTPIEPEIPDKGIITFTIMSMNTVVIYPDGKTFIKDKKCWIQEARNQPKKKPKPRKKFTETKIAKEEVY